jgi:hypothetical protein
MENNIQKIKDAIKKIFMVNVNNYIFVYTPPKVGSTTLVSSLRISLGRSFNVVHIHDDIMLNVLTGIKDISVNEIIHFLANEGNHVYVIDIYRNPIERKMSEFFEKIACYHFNNSEEQICRYNINRIIDRFNKLFPHLGCGDHYFEKYGISEIIPFDFQKKYSIQNINNIKYIKLRLYDSNCWGSILSQIFNNQIYLVKDYSTDNKSIGELYKKFKQYYRLPSNYYEIIKNCKYFNYYNNDEEVNKYLNNWSNYLSPETTGYTGIEYKFYVNLYLENQHINDMQLDHYIDNGCFCKLCSHKRKELYIKVKNNQIINEKINHHELVKKEVDIKNKLIVEKVKRVINHNNKIPSRQFTIRNYN